MIRQTHVNLTYQKSKMTAAKNPSHTFHGTPVFSAIRNIRVIVPRKRTLVFSKESFIFSAKAVESLISSPIALVSYIQVSSQHDVPRKDLVICDLRLTCFNILTLALMPSICSSFWLSSSLNTASLYCPR